MRKSYRVKREKEFQKVFFKGKSTANRKFVVYVLPKENQIHFRVGLSVGKKIGNAVARNSVKRKIRQSIFEMKEDLKQDCDFVVIARKGCEDLSFDELKQNLQHVFKIAKLLEK